MKAALILLAVIVGIPLLFIGRLALKELQMRRRTRNTYWQGD